MQSVSQFICDLKKIALSLKKQSIQLIMIGINCKSIYSELLQTGGIQSTCEGEKVIVNFQANVCGDILIFFEPKNHNANSVSDVVEMIQTDIALQQQKKYALESLRGKFQGLMVLPKMLTLLISVFLSLLMYWKASNIQSILNYQFELETIQKVVPLVILLIMFIFKKFIGFTQITH